MAKTIRPTIHLMVGLPYSGKSTYIRNHPTLSALSVVDSDSFIERRAIEEQNSYGAIFDREIGEAIKHRDWLTQVLIKNLWITPQCQGLINKFPSGLIFSENKLSTDGR